MNPYESRFQYDDDEADDDEPEHSALGIASFVIACVSAMIAFVCVAYAGILETITPGGIDETSTEVAIVGLGIIGGILLSLVSLGLAIAGLFQRDQKKIFPALGLVISLLVMAGAALLFIAASLSE